MVNAGFEFDIIPTNSLFVTRISGWTTSGNAGTFQPPASAYSSGAPQGSQVAYLNRGSSMRQVVANYVLRTGDTITLRAQLGSRSDMGAVQTVSLRLNASPLGSLLAVKLYNAATLTKGAFVTGEVSAVVPAALAGQSLEVLIVYEGTAQQVNVDDVQLVVFRA